MLLRMPIATLLTSTALVSAAAAQEQQPAQASPETQVAECQEMLQYVRENDMSGTGMTEERAQQIAQASDPQICTDALRLAQGEISETEGDANFDADARARLLVAVPEPEVTVTQSAPEVTVEQLPARVQVDPGAPTVTVNQAEPVVRVELAPPTITIDMPKPQILIEMPDPEVAVTTPQPRVRVTQPQPEVAVEQGEVQIRVGEQPVVAEQPESAEVAIEQDEATVAFEDAERARLQVAEVRPNVLYNAAEPRIEVERVGEPMIQFNQPGEAEVQIRQLTAEETDAMAEEAAAAVAPADGEPAIGDEVSVAPSTADDADAELLDTASLSVNEILEMRVIGADGESIGDVEDIVVREDATYIILGHGGFLGLGEKQVALPVEDMRFQNDQLVMRAITADEVERMEEVRLADFQAVDPAGEIEVFVE